MSGRGYLKTRACGRKAQATHNTSRSVDPVFDVAVQVEAPVSVDGGPCRRLFIYSYPGQVLEGSRPGGIRERVQREQGR